MSIRLVVPSTAKHVWSKYAVRYIYFTSPSTVRTCKVRFDHSTVAFFDFLKIYLCQHKALLTITYVSYTALLTYNP